jgi:hypothetical protein
MRRVWQGLAVVLVGGAVAGLAVRPATFEPQPTTSVQYDGTPDLAPVFPSGHHPEPRVAEARRDALGDPGFEWYSGYQWATKSLCIESGIVGAPLAEVAAKFRVQGLAVYVRFGYGGCAAAGFGPDKRVAFSYYTAADLAGDLKGACAYASIANYGDITSAFIRVNVKGGAAGQRTDCGAGPGGEWLDVFGHELLHTYGFSHEQPAITSLMRDGHVLDKYDLYRLGYLYNARPQGTPTARR